MSQQEKDDDSIAIGIDFGTTKISGSVWNKKTKNINMILDDKTHLYSYPSTLNFENANAYLEKEEIEEKGPVLANEEEQRPNEENSNNIQEDSKNNLMPHIGEKINEVPVKNVFVYDIKKILGNKTTDENLKKNINNYFFNIESDEKDRPIIKINNNNIDFEQLASFLFKRIIDSAENKFQNIVSSIVISVPHSFNFSQRQSIKQACEIQYKNRNKNKKLEIHLINDPTSAVIYYNFLYKIQKLQYFLVVDLGASCLDISMISTNKNLQIKVLATGGDTNLNSEMFNKTLSDDIIDKYQLDNGIDFSKNPEAMFKFKNAIDELKKELSFKTEAQINIPKLDNVTDLNMIISREEFDEINKTNYEKILNAMENVIKESKIERDKLNHVILLGESFKIQKLVEIISKKYEDCDIVTDLDDAVALGAGIYSAKISEKINNEKFKKLKIYEITPLTLGIRTEGDLMSVILPRGTKIPIKCKKNFITTQDYQTKLKFEIYEGERKLIRDNKRLGGMILNNLPEKLKGQVKVDVTFEIDVDGVLKVTAIENSQNLTKEIKEINIGNMTQEEINKKIKEAEKLFKDDKNEENRIKSMLKLNDLLVNYTHKYSENEEIKKILDQFRNWLKHSTQLPKEEYDKKIEELNKSIPKENEKKGEEKKEKKIEETTEGKEKNIETNLEKNNENNINNNEGIANENINEGQNNEVQTAV